MKNLIYFIFTLSLITQAFTQNQKYDFEGIVKLNNCSGSVIKFAGQPDNAKAIIMTNGHCITGPNGGMLAAGEVLVNYQSPRTFEIFGTTVKKVVKASSNKILYATMTNTDVAFYETTTTYRELEAQGISALLLSSERAVEGTDIQVISGYWKRGYACSIDAFIFKMKEASWTWLDSMRYSQPGCETIGGTSGSPVIDANSRAVIGINNTGNDDGEKCTMMNPCEVDENGKITVRKKASYGQQVYQVYSCLTVDFKIDLKKADCKLAKPNAAAGFQNSRQNKRWTKPKIFNFLRK